MDAFQYGILCTRESWKAMSGARNETIPPFSTPHSQAGIPPHRLSTSTPLYQTQVVVCERSIYTSWSADSLSNISVLFETRKFPLNHLYPPQPLTFNLSESMNKGSVATASNISVKPPVNTTKSAWAKGPPQPLQQPQPPAGPSSATANTSRSNTPNPSANATPAHSRRPSQYTPAVGVKGGQPRPGECSPQSTWKYLRILVVVRRAFTD